MAQRSRQNKKWNILKLNDMQTFFAVDLGATSGRTIVGRLGQGNIELEEINRFPNHIIQVGKHYFWDIYALYNNIIEGLKIVAQKGIQIDSIGIDTWGVDFVMIGKDGEILGQPYCYRDPHTNGAPERYFGRVDRSKVYGLTGIQVMNFNSLFQFDTLRENRCSALEAAEHILFIPDALSYMLTGEMVTEYTIASTAQIVNAKTRALEPEILSSVGLKAEMFGKFVMPGETIGVLRPEVQEMTGLGAVKVVAVAGHDTGSAVAAVPAANADFAYLSSGTWSLMGVETQEPVISELSEKLNFTNEGGVEGTIRVLKNICGMWMLERCRAEWDDNMSYPDLIALAQAAEPFKTIVNPDDAIFANPQSMTKAIAEYCEKTQQPVPADRGALVRCIFESLAMRYRCIMDMLSELSPVNIKVLHVIGGGSRNKLLNQFTANALGIPVVAGPGEATAMGNMMVQAVSCGAAKNIADMRVQLSQSDELERFEPKDAETWNAVYKKLDIYK